MKRRNVFSVADFAYFARTTRDTLIYYDKIGLLSPMNRGRNGYRYYSGAQLAAVNLIRTCRELGMQLSDIRDLVEHRTPPLVAQYLDKHIKQVDERINEWVSARKLLQTLKETIEEAVDVDETEITLKEMPATAIVLGKQNDYSDGRDDYDALLDFYYDCQKNYPKMNLNYPVWGTFAEERIKKGDWVWPDRFFFCDPDGLDRKPAALYAIGYKRGGYGQSDDLYRRMLKFVGENDLEICGPAYEEYPLNELCIIENDNYLMRVMLTVRPVDKEAKQAPPKKA